MSLSIKRGRLANLKAPPSNPNASTSARLLHGRLLNLFGSRAGSQRPMFIGCNETAATAPYYVRTGQHIEALTGKHPLVKTFWPVSSANPAYPALIAAIKDHHRKGGICGVIWHPNNILTGGNNYDRSRDDWDAVLACLTGGSHVTQYRATQDSFVLFLNDCVDDNGQLIPFFVRIGNETNGWRDYEDMTVTSLTRSGTTATMTFTRGANPLAVQWGAANCQFRINGASDTKWNKTHFVGSYVANGDGSGGTVTFTVTDSPTSSPSGTITAYPLAGDWWAGADRRADVITLWRQTIAYFRDVKGCNQLIWGLNLFTYNRLAASMNPATTDQGYELWLDPAADYCDIVTSNLYQDEPLSWGFCDFGATDVVSAYKILENWAIANGRPIFYTEMGARYNGKDDPLFWSTKCMNAFDAKYPSLAGACTWTPPTFLPDAGTPAGVDFGAAFSKSRYRWLGQ